MHEGPITTLALELAELDNSIGRKLRSVLKLPLGIGDMVRDQLRSIDDTPGDELAEQLEMASMLTERLATSIRSGKPIDRDLLTSLFDGLPAPDDITEPEATT